MISTHAAPARPERRPSRRLLGCMAVAGLACVPGIFLLQGKACGVEQFPAVLSPAIFFGLAVSGVLGIANGLLISYRQPGNRIGWLCAITGVVGLAAAFTNRYALCGLYGSLRLPGVAAAAWISYVLAPLVIALVFWQIPLWFPYGQYLSSRWKAVAALAWGVLLGCLALAALLPGELGDNGAALSYALPNPLGLPLLAAPALRRLAPLLLSVTLLAASLAANLSLVLRWRRARGDERQQIKWFAFFGGVVVSLFVVIEIIGRFVAPGLFRSPVYVVAFYLAWIGFPVVIGLSVLKYRLYDIDFIIRRTLAYAAVSVLLAVIYLGSVTVLQLIFAGISGQRSQATIVLSTLLIAGLFNPLRRALQRGVDRRFYRSKYDAARTLEQFSAAIRDEVELKQLLENLQAAVEETLQPEEIGVWLAQPADRYSMHGKTA